jgi:hypothetical protein
MVLFYHLTWCPVLLDHYNLLILQNRKIQNYRTLAQSLKGIATNCMGELSRDSKWLQRHRIQMVRAVSGVVATNFITREGMDPTALSWVENLENILNQSRTENVCYDFKIGLHSLSHDNSFNKALLSKIVRTLTAMCNSHTGDNYVIIGVAEKEADAIRHNQTYASSARKYDNFYVAGVGAEATQFHGGLDQYQQLLQQTIDKEPVNDDIKRQIQRNIVFIKYYDKDVVLLKLSRGKHPMRYDGKIYVRKIANTDPTPIQSDDEFVFFEGFSEQSNRYPYQI